MGMYKYFIQPFANAGDVLTIPNDTQPSGSVSYQEGFGFDYQRDLATDPDALAVPRDSMNQLFLDITTAVQQYQQLGTPNFITTSDNGGSPFSYPIYARVLYDAGSGFEVYENQVDGNTTLPTDPSWQIISGGDAGAQFVYITNASFDGSVNDGDMVAWNSGSSLFVQAQANGTATQNLIGQAQINVDGNRVLILGVSTEGFSTLIPGATYYLSNTAPGGITSTPGDSTNLVRVGVAASATELYFQPQFVTNCRAKSFTTSTTFTVPINVTQIYVSAVGGGGGGGGSAAANATSGNPAKGGGGGGGGGGGRNIIKFPLVVTPLETLTVTIGAGGTAGASGGSLSAGGNGGAGGTTQLLRSATPLATAAGGGGGLGGMLPGDVYSSGAAGGAIGGQPGTTGFATIGTIQGGWGGNGGAGGGTIFGIGGQAGFGSGGNADGNVGSSAVVTNGGYGGGGGGASGASRNSSGNQAGAAGGTGATRFYADRILI